MGASELRSSALAAEEPPTLPAPLVALWWTARGDWERAHTTAQADHSADGAWVHAHLHRVEGDLDNARYWYGRAGRPPSTADLDAEWEEIAEALMAKSRTA